MQNSTNDFHKLSCTIRHVKHHNEEGITYAHGKYPHGEYYYLHPLWNCREWEVQLEYIGKTIKPFNVYTPSEIDILDKMDVLMIIFQKDFRTTNIVDFRKTDEHQEYIEFFNNHKEWYDGSKEVERVLQNHLRNGLLIPGRLYKLLGKEEYYALKEFMGYEKN